MDRHPPRPSVMWSLPMSDPLHWRQRSASLDDTLLSLLTYLSRLPRDPSPQQPISLPLCSPAPACASRRRQRPHLAGPPKHDAFCVCALRALSPLSPSPSRPPPCRGHTSRHRPHHSSQTAKQRTNTRRRVIRCGVGRQQCRAICGGMRQDKTRKAARMRQFLGYKVYFLLAPSQDRAVEGPGAAGRITAKRDTAAINPSHMRFLVPIIGSICFRN